MSYYDLALLDFLFVITLTWYVIACAFLAISGRLLEASKSLGKGLFYAALEVAVLGHFVFGVSFGALFQRYVTGGAKILPQLVTQIFVPLVKEGWKWVSNG